MIINGMKFYSQAAINTLAISECIVQRREITWLYYSNGLPVGYGPNVGPQLPKN